MLQTLNKLIILIALILSIFILYTLNQNYKTQDIVKNQFLLSGLNDSLMQINNNICNRYDNRDYVIKKLQEKCDYYTKISDSTLVLFVDDTSGLILVNRSDSFLNLTHKQLDSLISSPALLMDHVFEGEKLKALSAYYVNNEQETATKYLYDYFRKDPSDENKRLRIWRQSYILYNNKHGIILGITRTPNLSDNNIYDMILLAYQRQRRYNTGYILIGVFLSILSIVLWNITAKYRKILYTVNNASSAISITSTDGKIKWVNDTFLKWHQTSEDKIIGNLLWSIDSFGEKVEKRFFSFINNKGEEKFTYTSKVGNKRTETVWNKYPDPGTIQEIVSVHTDITELADFVAFIPHEVKSPVQGLMTYVRGLLLQREDLVHKKELIPILEGVETSLTLGNNLSLWAKSRYEKSMGILERINVHNAVNTLLEPFELILDHYKIEVSNNTRAELCITTFNKPMFHAVIRNIISNAVNSIAKKTGESSVQGYKGFLDIRSNNGGLEFIDNGLGIEDESQLNNLFNYEDGRYGWGTAICTRFVTQYGGAISAKHNVAENGIKQGLIITFSFPKNEPYER